MIIRIADPAALGGDKLAPQIEQMLASRRQTIGILTPVEERSKNSAENEQLLRLVARAEVETVEDRLLEVDGRMIPVRIYIPDSATELFPILVFMHGGGWVIGDLNQPDAVCRKLAKEASCLVVSVAYRLAPEHKFPAALEDVYAVLEWLAGYASTIKGDPGRIALGGGSAGANLAAAVSLLARDRDGPRLAAQLLFVPVTDLSGLNAGSSEWFGREGYGLTAETLNLRCRQYLPTMKDRFNPYVSPLLANDLSDLPPALIITAEFDLLRSQGEAYALRLAKAGIPVRCTRYNGMSHGFFVWLGVIDQAQAAVSEAAEYLCQIFGIGNTA